MKSRALGLPMTPALGAPDSAGSVSHDSFLDKRFQPRERLVPLAGDAIEGTSRFTMNNHASSGNGHAVTRAHRQEIIRSFVPWNKEGVGQATRSSRPAPAARRARRLPNSFATPSTA